MATIKLSINHAEYDVPVNLPTTTPFDLMVYAVYVLGQKPVGGSIWKMRKSARPEIVEENPFFHHFVSLNDDNNRIADGETIEFVIV